MQIYEYISYVYILNHDIDVISNQLMFAFQIFNFNF